MLETYILAPLDLPQHLALLAIGVVFLAGLVRGFSGFAQSAIIMACLAPFIPPLALIPVCWILELAASALMVKSSFKEANHSITIGLLIGALIGLPIGLTLTTTLPVETSKIIVLLLITVLTLLQFSKIKLPFLATKTGLYGTGIFAGILSGLASIGGMVVALYVLASNAPARSMRASLVSFLFLSSVLSAALFAYYGIFTQTAFLRGLILIVPTLLGVAIGKIFFRPSLEPYYKPFCLSLLAALALVGLARTAF